MCVFKNHKSLCLLTVYPFSLLGFLLIWFYPLNIQSFKPPSIFPRLYFFSFFFRSLIDGEVSWVKKGAFYTNLRKSPLLNVGTYTTQQLSLTLFPHPLTSTLLRTLSHSVINSWAINKEHEVLHIDIVSALHSVAQ